VRKEVLNPHNIKGKITVLYTLIFVCDSKRFSTEWQQAFQNLSASNKGNDACTEQNLIIRFCHNSKEFLVSINDTN
jgi:hypothetical protein